MKPVWLWMFFPLASAWAPKNYEPATNLTAEISNEFMKASQVTKVTSTGGHPRTQGLVERQNRTLLTLLRVFCSRRMPDWDQHLDEVLGAYNSTRPSRTNTNFYTLDVGSRTFASTNSNIGQTLGRTITLVQARGITPPQGILTPSQLTPPCLSVPPWMA